MNLPDIINGLFEGLASLFILNHCRVLHKDKCVRGISVVSVIFFTAWGFWNLFYYPHLGQWLSFTGGVLIVAANCLWVSLLLKYKNR